MGASPRALATALALNRLAFGLGFLASPSSARSWIGRRAASRPETQVFIRALGAREVALAAGGLLALSGGDEEVASRWMAGHAISDGVDLVATLAARRDLPALGTAFAVGMASASTAVGAWSAYRLARG